MRKIKEVLRLKFKTDLSHRRIARKKKDQACVIALIRKIKKGR